MVEVNIMHLQLQKFCRITFFPGKFVDIKQNILCTSKQLSTASTPMGLYKGVRKGLGAKHPLLSLIFYKNFITFAKKVNCFRILFGC